MPFIPHTPAEVSAMLATVGVDELGQLFDEIPPPLLDADLSAIPTGISEMSMHRQFADAAASNNKLTCFLGAGAYDHHIPALVWDLAARGEFYTAYTPYQAEASQGGLQLVYEFQTMMASLTGMDVANASVYDGASGLGEAILMAARANRRTKSRKVIVVGQINPFYLSTARSLVAPQGIELVSLTDECGSFQVGAHPPEEAIAVVVQQPNFFGLLEDVDEIVQWAHDANALLIAIVNPVSLGLLEPPGQWGETGADIVVGDGQPLGIPMSFGGPSFGFICTRQEHVRQLPGRIVGRTLDLNGNPGYTLTLQAREQHIRRAKATSNICTNQGLLVTAATMYLSCLGPQGLAEVARTCHAHTVKLVSALLDTGKARLRLDRPYFHECVLEFDEPTERLSTRLCEQGILGGLPLGSIAPSMTRAMLVCATERRTNEEIERYRDVLLSG